MSYNQKKHIMTLYTPREDSRLLEKEVSKYAFGNVLDIGTGLGIQAAAASKKKNVKSVLAVDIQKAVVEHCRKSVKNKKIRFAQSDLFSNVKGRFDSVIFNPPYLPEDKKLKDLTVEGGKKGYEILERFLNDVDNYLKPNGIILTVLSSLTKKDKVDGFIERNLLESKELTSQHIFFEDLYVYLIKKTGLRKQLEEAGVKKLRYFTHGHRGILFRAEWKAKEIVIKAKNPRSMAIGRIENEAKWIRILNEKGIGPKLLFSAKDYLVYEYVPGEFILDYIKKLKKGKRSRQIIRRMIKNVFEQCYFLDSINVNKEEMHHPVKHVIITKSNKAVMLDFERCHKARKAKNVTQLCQFLRMRYFTRLLGEKEMNVDEDKVMEIAKKYKKAGNYERTGLIKRLLEEAVA